MLTDFNMVEQIDLSNNDLDDSSASQIARILEENPTIITLNLSKNNIGQKGLQTVCSALSEKTCKVKRLDISDNPIPEGALKILMALLCQN